MARRINRRSSVLAKDLRLDRPSTLAQALAGVGHGVHDRARRWYFADLIGAFQASFNSAPVEQLWPIRESAVARGYYQLAFSLLTVGLGFGLVRVLQLRRRKGHREGRLSVAALVAVIAVTILFTEVPYRSFNYRDFERVDVRRRALLHHRRKRQ